MQFNHDGGLGEKTKDKRQKNQEPGQEEKNERIRKSNM